MATFVLTPHQDKFEENMVALAQHSDDFNISVWPEGSHAVDCSYARYNGLFFGYSVKGQLGEHRVTLDKIREVCFWPKRRN